MNLFILNSLKHTYSHIFSQHIFTPIDIFCFPSLTHLLKSSSYVVQGIVIRMRQTKANIISAATVGNTTKGFEKTGIFPLNANAIPDHKFIGDQESDIVESQDQSPNSQQMQPQDQFTNTKPPDYIMPSTSSQSQSDEAQPRTCVEIIKEILPSPLKSPMASKRIRKVSKPTLHLTSPQSKTNLLEEEI
ncbi:hypothetical protein HHI36_016536 [Cryptolaemus montrouzieri]|uniref:Uncharacterized protein n=1 Tax=Cryptolaemus montrouzieri TaxID=559131 RepID=A0ABD2NKT9_9CUCU